MLRLTKNSKYRVCAHIVIAAEEADENEYYEYAQILIISCEACKGNYEFEIAVN